MPITQLPTPVPSRADPANFAVRADAFLSALPTFVTEANTLATDVTNAESSALAARNAAQSSATSSQTNATLAASYAGAQPWVSGQVYALGAAVYSNVNFRIYRRKSAGSSGTDPSADTTNWGLVANILTAETPAELIVRGTDVVNATPLKLNTSYSLAGTTSLALGGFSTDTGSQGSSIIRSHHNHFASTANALSFWTNGGAGPSDTLERVRIAENGNVGVGTSSPTARLDVSSTGTYQAIFRGTSAGDAAGVRTVNSNGTAGVALLTYGSAYVGGSVGNVGQNGSVVIQTGNAPIYIGTDNGISQPTLIGTNGLERMRIDASGNVGVGTTTAASKFEVSSETPSVADFSGSVRVTNTSFTAGTYAGTLFKTGDTLNSFVTAVRKAGFGGTLVFATNRGANANDLVESMRLDDAGRVCINDNSNIFSNLTVRAVGGASGTVSLSGSSGASYVVLGNRDSLGATGPSVITSSNRAIQFGVGDSHSNTAGGTFTEFGRFSSTGNFGVGINPTVRFEVATSAGGRLRVDTSNPAENIVTSSNFAGTVFSTSISDAAAHVFRTSGTERARIDSNGNTSFAGRLVWVPPTSEPTLATNGQLTVTALSNTSVRISLRGTDGVQRGVTLTLS